MSVKSCHNCKHADVLNRGFSHTFICSKTYKVVNSNFMVGWCNKWEEKGLYDDEDFFEDIVEVDDGK